jgi:hypothetical protein
MKAGEVGLAPSGVIEIYREHGLRFNKQLTGLIQKLSGFRRHISSPSRRISRINGVRSIQDDDA